MADIDPYSIPSQMPAEQPIAQKDGRPTTAMQDWFSAIRSWMKQSVVDLTTKITTLTATIGDLSAEITEEATIRETEDGILASHITSVEAKANNATANGQVYLQAMAGPAGSAAAYGIFLTAGSVFTGLMLVARSDGTSYIALVSGQLFFYDNSSGQEINMLAYSGGEWVLNGNVTLQSATGAGTMRWANGNITIYDSSGVDRVTMGVNL